MIAIKEQIGYPDYILEDQNEKLDQEYANVSKTTVILCDTDLCICRFPFIKWVHLTEEDPRGSRGSAMQWLQIHHLQDVAMVVAPY